MRIMTKNKTKLLVIVTLVIGLAAALVPFVLWNAHATPVERSVGDNRSFAPVFPVTSASLPAVGNVFVRLPEPKVYVPTPAPASVSASRAGGSPVSPAEL